jgi:hypothetical protein
MRIERAESFFFQFLSPFQGLGKSILTIAMGCTPFSAYISKWFLLNRNSRLWKCLHFQIIHERKALKGQDNKGMGEAHFPIGFPKFFPSSVFCLF